MKRKLYIAGFILFVLSCYLFLFYKYGATKDKIDFQKIEAIVVLTGEKGRIPEGIKIFNRNKNLYLIISGANPKYPQDFLRKKIGLTGEKNIIIENKSKNTIENAIEVKKILEKLKVKHILLITSCFHIPRAYLIFKIILPSDIKIYKWGVGKKFNLNKILKENIKIIYFIFFYLIYNFNLKT